MANTLWVNPGGDGQSVFTDYHFFSRYEKDRHTYLMGLTTPTAFKGDTAAIVRLAAPTMLWVLDWTASRFKVMPQVPDPTAPDGWVCLADDYELADVALDNSGSVPLYRISGTYIYARRKAPDSVLSEATFPVPPCIDGTGVIRTVPADFIVRGIKEDTTTTINFPSTQGMGK